MASPWRNLKNLALFAGIAGISIAGGRLARAEIDLNRLVFPKVPSASQSPTETDDAPPMPKMKPSDRKDDRDQNSRAKNDARNNTNRNVPASYQSTPAYQAAPNNHPAANAANAPNANRQTYGDMRAVNNPQAGNNFQNNNFSAGNANNPYSSPYPSNGYRNGDSGGYGPSSSARAGWSVAGMLGLEQSSPPPSGIRMASMTPGGSPQSVMSGPMPNGSLPNRSMQNGPLPNGIPPGSVISDRVASSGAPVSNSPTMIGKPSVKPDAVYLEGESIPPGAMKSGTVINGQPMMSGPMPSGTMMSGPMSGPMMMDGGTMSMDGMPMMDGGGDGFSNPYCNNCNGGPGGCGCGQCNGGCGWFGGGCSRGGECGECENCGHQCPYGRPWILAPIDLVVYVLGPPGDGSWWWGENMSVFAGVHNFRNPVNVVGQSNFGTQEGLNWAVPLWAEAELGAQVGVGVTQSNFQDSGFPFDDYRNQTFVTAGLFHRPQCGQGFQYGMVFDWLHDDFYDNFDIAQLRGEISWLFDSCDELGFWFASGVFDDQVHDQFLSPATFEVLDQYAFFYRRRFCRGGDARIWGGFTGEDGGLVGADFSLPIARSLSIEAGFNYVITDHRTEGRSDESWNLGMNLVWYWGGKNCGCNPYRPLFNVADNGSLMTRLINRSQ